MDKFLNRICKIRNHSISKLDRSFAHVYIQGLGSILYILTEGSDIAQMYYNVWAQSIMKDKEDYASQYWIDDKSAVKKALSFKRKGWRLFTMKNDFFFDVYHLYISSLGNLADIDKIFDFLSKNFCGSFSKKALKRVHKYYHSEIDSLNKVGKPQLRHKEQQDQYQSEPERKVLVVANVSAGKSTLINALIGFRLSRTRTTVCTNRLIEMHNKRGDDGITIKTFNGNYLYNNDIEAVDIDGFCMAAFPFHSELKHININIIDSPGVNNVTDSTHRAITEKTIKNGDYDVIVYVSNCQYFGTNDERDLLLTLKNNVKSPIVFVLNQLDNFKQKEDSVKKMVGDFRNDLVRIGFKNPIICPVSAKAALLFKIPDERLDEEDLETKEEFKSKFTKEFFDLQSYITGISKEDSLERTGIIQLEQSIIKTLKTIKKNENRIYQV